MDSGNFECVSKIPCDQTFTLCPWKSEIVLRLLSNKIMQYLRLLTIQLILLWSPFYFNEFFQHWLRLFLRFYPGLLSISGFRSSVMFLFEVVFTMWFWGDVILVVIEIWEPMIRVLFDFFPFLKGISVWISVILSRTYVTYDMLRRPSVGP